MATYPTETYTNLKERFKSIAGLQSLETTDEAFSDKQSTDDSEQHINVILGMNLLLSEKQNVCYQQMVIKLLLTDLKEI